MKYDIAGKIIVFFTVFTCSAYILSVLLGSVTRTQAQIYDLEYQSNKEMQILSDTYEAEVQALKEEIDRLDKEKE